MWVGGIGDMTDHDVRDFFSSYGEVVEVQVKPGKSGTNDLNQSLRCLLSLEGPIVNDQLDFNVLSMRPT